MLDTIASKSILENTRPHSLTEQWLHKVDQDFLIKTKTEIGRKRKRMVKAMIELFDTIDTFKIQSNIPEVHAEAWLHNECGLSRGDMNAFRKFPKLGEEARKTIANRRVMFETVKALIATDNGTRTEALDRIDKGQVIDPTEIRSIRRANRAAEMSDQSATRLAVRDAARRAAQATAKAMTSCLETSASSLFDALKAYDTRHAGAEFGGDADYYDYVGENPDFESDHWNIVELAKAALKDFETIFPGPHLTDQEWLKSILNETESRLARTIAVSHRCLVQIAKGSFSIRWGRITVNGADPLPLISSLFRGKPDAPIETRERFGLRPVKTLTALELCAGAGGEAIGLSQANFRPLALVDSGLHAVRTLRRNKPDWNILRADLSEAETHATLAAFKGKVDLLAGGVPCQPFSNAGKREGEKDERDLFPDAVKLVEAVRPKAFFFENVEGIENEEFLGTRLGILSRTLDLNYSVGTFTIAAVDWGLAQARRRVIIYGLSKDLGDLKFPVPAPVIRTKATFETTIVDTLFPYLNRSGPTFDAAESFMPDQLKMYENWARRWISLYGGNVAPTVTGWPAAANINRSWRAKGLNFEVLTEQATRPDEVTDLEMLPPVTIPLLLKLQGFPAGWELSANAPLNVKAQLIANAFPPVLARVVASQLHGLLSREVISLDAVARDPIVRPEVQEPPRKPSLIGPRLVYPDDPRRQQAYLVNRMLAMEPKPIEDWEDDDED